MECQKPPQITSFIFTSTHKYFLFLFILPFFISGCNKKLSNPEKIDPIYKDLIKEQKEYENLAEDIKKQKVNAIEKQRRLLPRSLKKKLNRKTIKKLSKKFDSYTQKAKFFSIKAKSRLKHVRIAYEKAFQNNQPWPNTKEYEYYTLRKKLQNAPRKWVQSSSHSNQNLQKSSESSKNDEISD